MKFNFEKRKYNETASEKHLIDVTEDKHGAVSAGPDGYVLMKEGKIKEPKEAEKIKGDLEEMALKPDHKVKERSFNPSKRSTSENISSYLASVEKQHKEYKSQQAKNAKTNRPYREWKNEGLN